MALQGITPRVGRVATQVLFIAIDVTAAGDTQIVASVPGQRIKVTSYVIVADANTNLRVTWKSGILPLSGAMRLSGVIAAAGTVEAWLMETRLGQSLVLNRTGSVPFQGHAAYFLEP